MTITTATQQKAKKAGNYVTTNHTEALLSTYKKERWVHNSKRIGKEDSLSVWYSVDELMEFLETAKRNGADGIKMYFGAYTAETAKSEGYTDRQTIVMVASKHKQLDNGTAFDKSIYVKSEKGVEILAYNTGRICPPYCGGDGTGTGTDTMDWDNLGIVLIDKKDEGMVVV